MQVHQAYGERSERTGERGERRRDRQKREGGRERERVSKQINQGMLRIIFIETYIVKLPVGKTHQFSCEISIRV